MYGDPSEIFYMDIGAVNVLVASEVAPGGIPVCKYFKKIKLIEEKRNTSFIRINKIIYDLIYTVYLLLLSI